MLNNMVERHSKLKLMMKEYMVLLFLCLQRIIIHGIEVIME